MGLGVVEPLALWNSKEFSVGVESGLKKGEARDLESSEVVAVVEPGSA